MAVVVGAASCSQPAELIHLFPVSSSLLLAVPAAAAAAAALIVVVAVIFPVRKSQARARYRSGVHESVSEESQAKWLQHRRRGYEWWEAGHSFS